MFRNCLPAALALAIFPGTAMAAAQALSRSCGPLKEVASLTMTVLADGARVSVPITINGKPVSLLVDTGAGVSSLTKSAAATLDMRLRDSQVVRLFNEDGVALHRYYVADSFQLGPLTAKNIAFMQGADSDTAPVGGAIGPDLMARYDVEMDFSDRRLTYFSQDHCPGHVVHWPSDAVTPVPITTTARAKNYPPALFPGAVGGLSPDFVAAAMAQASPILGTDIRTKVMLDGQAFTANIDTGLAVSTINSEAARNSFAVSVDDRVSDAPVSQQDQPSVAGTEAVTVTALRRQHRFHSLTFGGVTVVNPLFVLKPNPADAHRVGAAQAPDITIGMNVLRALHLYFAFGEHVLYVSAAGRQASALSAQGNQNDQ